MAKPVVGIQLYSLRDQTEKDFIGTLEKVVEMGFKAVEFSGFFEITSRELKKKLKEFDLKSVSAHVSLNFPVIKKLESDLAKQIEYAQSIGLQYIIAPWIPLPEEPTLIDIKYLSGVLTKCGQQVKDAGMQFGYHNHDFEFKLLDGKPVIDHLLERVPPELMTMEFDFGWMYLAGHNPAYYLNKYKDRVKMVHFKDFAKGRKDIEVGKGDVGYESLYNDVCEVDVDYIFVEQEAFSVSSLESAQANYHFFKKFNIL